MNFKFISSKKDTWILPCSFCLFLLRWSLSNDCDLYKFKGDLFLSIRIGDFCYSIHSYIFYSIDSWPMQLHTFKEWMIFLKKISRHFSSLNNKNFFYPGYSQLKYLKFINTAGSIYNRCLQNVHSHCFSFTFWNTMKQEPDTLPMFVSLIKLDTCGKWKCTF